MEVIRIGEKERDFWDREIARFSMAHPLNAYGWGKVRDVDGWCPAYYIVKNESGLAGMMMVLRKKLPVLGLSIMYAPKGPVWENDEGGDILKALLSRVREDARESGAIFLRIDPNIEENQFDINNDPFVKEGFVHLIHRWSFWNSPRDVYRIDLTKARDADELFGTIDRDARRCVRKAKNEGVVIRAADSLPDLRKFYDIFSRFSIDKGFMSRAYEYQESLWREYIEKGNGMLFLAVYRGETIGGLLCLRFGDKCIAMHMGTPYEYQSLQTSYAYLWESIKWAKEKGCVWYSFRGVGSSSSQECFKRKFSPRAVHLSGYYDLVFMPLAYKLFYHLEFNVLPRCWHTLMVIRKSLGAIKSILGKLGV